MINHDKISRCLNEDNNDGGEGNAEYQVRMQESESF